MAQKRKSGTPFDHLIGTELVEDDTGLTFLVLGVIKRRRAVGWIVWGRSVTDRPTGHTFGASTLGEYCANLMKTGEKP